MNIENELNQLKKISKVTPSPMLLMRIKQRIATASEATIQWKLGIAATLALLIVMNGIAVFKSAKNPPKTTASMVTSMHLSVNNQLYHD